MAGIVAWDDEQGSGDPCHIEAVGHNDGPLDDGKEGPDGKRTSGTARCWLLQFRAEEIGFLGRRSLFPLRQKG